MIACFHGIISKNILSTDALRVLDGKGWDIVVLVPSNKIDLFRKYYPYPNVRFEGVETGSITNLRLNNTFLFIARLLVDSHYLWYKKMERRQAAPGLRNKLKYQLEVTATKLLSGSRLVHGFFRAVDGLVNRHRAIRDLLVKHRTTVFFATDVFDKMDAAFISEAKRLKIPVIGMVRSWDNCWSKGLLRAIPDRLLVNNEVIKEEAISLHDVAPSSVEVVGLPQFDIFLKGATLKSREDFFKEIGADPGKKLVLFSPVGEPLSHTDWQILDMLQKNLATKKITDDFQVLVRLHPGREMPLGRLDITRDFIFDKPGLGAGKEVEFLPNDSLRLANSLYHSDIVIWVATTLGIDAAVYNKPQIVANFDGYEEHEYIDSVKRYHDEDHMKRMLACGGVKIVNDETELVDAVNAYFSDPSLDDDKRRLLVREQLYRLDGLSGQRLAQSVISFVESRGDSRA